MTQGEPGKGQFYPPQGELLHKKMSQTIALILKFPQLQWLQCSISPAETGRI